jgi:hypothetical protein
MTDIPRLFHFVFGLRPQDEPFHLVHYLALESCRRVNAPEAILFHYLEEPWGEWWERIRPYLQLHPVDPEPFVRDSARYANSAEGRVIRQRGLEYAHESDFIRMKVLQRWGGVYADIDTLFLQPLPAELFRERFVIGAEQDDAEQPDPMARSLCNALMLARADSEFLHRWLERMYQVFDGTWSRHSCQEATRLRRLMPEQVRVLPKRCFHRHGADPAGVRTLFEGLDADFTGMVSMHLWAHLWWDEWRTDFTTVHGAMIDEEYVRHADTTYALAARRFLD